MKKQAARKETNTQKGAVAPLIAVLLLVIVVCVALVVDLGHIHNVKVELQRAVDAAALAGAHQIPDEGRVKTVAIAAAHANSSGQAPVAITSDDVILGRWDQNALGSSASERFTATTVNADAVYVKAALDVAHIFFFFVEDTRVIADAIALSRPTYPILPLAMVSCIPTDETETPPGTFPDMSICGVVGLGQNTSYDLSAWTSLTFSPVSEQSILDILSLNGTFETFNQIVFGQGLEGALATGGLENEPTSSPIGPGYDPDYLGCVNDGLTITCGLGDVGDEGGVAPPDDFNPPAGLLPLQTAVHPSGNSYYTGDSGFDPLFAYNPLPRWYDIDDPDADGDDTDGDGFDEDDHFIRIMTMDGILLPGPDETENEYKARLWELKTAEGALPYVTSPYSTDDGVNNRFEDLIGGSNINQTEPDYLAVAQSAGYPLVHVTEGVTTPILEAFLMRIFNTDDKKDIQNPLPCDENKPLPDSTESLQSIRLNVPVIFAGSCEKWKTNPSTKGYYIGMAKFLLTRSMLTNEMFACAEGSRTYAGGCPSGTFESPELDALGEFGLNVKFNSPSMLEGLFTLPTTDDDGDEGGLVDIFLVE